jgi:hypothetical protein
MWKLLPILFLALFLAVAGTYLPLKRELVYRLGISGDTSTSCCNGSFVENQDGSFDESASIAMFDGEVIDYPKTSLAQKFDENTKILGTMSADGVEKWIEVSLKTQTLRAWEGNKLVMEYKISSGKWSPTPTGTYSIWYKTRYQKMSGGSRELGTYYYLPNVPHNMFFHQGYAIHGAYWHNNFGIPMSHGCVNEPLAQAAQLFEWAGPYVSPEVNAVKASPENPGTRVLVHNN